MSFNPTDRYVPMLAISVATFTCVGMIGPVFIDPQQPVQLACAQAGDYNSDSSTNTNASGADDSRSSPSDASEIMGGDSAGTVRLNSLDSPEAQLNIIANLMEIWGISYSASSFIGAIVSFIKRHYIIGGLLLFLTPVSFTIGLAAPGLINWIVASAGAANNQEVVNILPFICGISFLVMLMGFGFIPTMIAFARRHPQKWLIMLCTFFSWLVPFGWPALLFWAYFDPRPQAPAQPG